MKLVASMNTRNELGRYLRLTAPAILEWCDELVVQDDLSDDGTFEFLQELAEETGRVTVKRNSGYRWAENEGYLHQQLLDLTLTRDPTHVLAIDADEYVVDGPRVRSYVEEIGDAALAFSLRMVELWHQAPPAVRVDGGWRPHPVGILFRVPPDHHGTEWQIWGRKMAGGRVPKIIRTEQKRGRHVELNVDIVHLGWSREEERQGRAQRYFELDGGEFHAAAHLNSILLPDSKVDLRDYPAENLPAGLT